MISRLRSKRRRLCRKTRRKRTLRKLRKRYNLRKRGKLKESFKQKSKHEKMRFSGVKWLLREDEMEGEEDEEEESMAEEEQESPLILDEVFPMKTVLQNSSSLIAVKKLAAAISAPTKSANSTSMNSKQPSPSHKIP
jgi:hypothetical protein